MIKRLFIFLLLFQGFHSLQAQTSSPDMQTVAGKVIE